MVQRAISLEGESGFRVLFECATISILVIDEEGGIRLANPCAEKLFGYEPSELLGKSMEILIPKNLHVRQEHPVDYLSNTKTRPMGLGMELYARKKSSEIFPVTISLGHYELEGDKLAVAIITDITDQVNAKKVIAEREVWFRNMADNSPVMIWVSDTTKGCSYFNKTWLEFTGKPLEDELGNGWLSGVHPEDQAQCIRTYNDCFGARKPFQMEYRLQRHDGQYRWILDVGKPTFLDNNFTGYIGSCSEIHEHKVMNEELEQLVRVRTDELYQALDREKEMGEMKSRFVSMASHEFRTPLTIVLSSASLIEQYIGSDMDERVEQNLTRIKSSVNRLTNILNDFLSLDKLDQGMVELTQGSFDMVDFIKEIVEEVKVLRKKDQIIEISHEGTPIVFLDQEKLRYIILNLLTNAVKYSPVGSVMKVITKNESEKILVQVTDQGLGIPDNEQTHMYKKFFRAKNAGSIDGTGLGLTIVKRYVELMNGKVTFVSKIGEGTTFTIELPL